MKNLKKRTKRIIIAAAVVVVIAGVAVTYSVISTSAAQAAKFGTTYGTDVARTGDISLTVSGSGNLASENIATVNADTHLDIDKVLVAAGDTVTAGQDIATLDVTKMQTFAETLQKQITTDEDSLNTTISTSKTSKSGGSTGSGGTTGDGSTGSGSTSSTSTTTSTTPTTKTRTTTTTTSTGSTTTTVTSPNAVTNFEITSPAKGWVKNIMVGTKSSNDSIDDAMNDTGYLAVVATKEEELISAANSSLAEGASVKVKCESHTYTGTVVNINGSLYVQIDTITRTIGADADVYDTNGNQLFTGQIQLESYVPIVSNYGTITSVKVKENSSVSVGAVLFKAQQTSLAIKNLYSDLNDLQAQYSEIENLISAGKLTTSDAGIIDTLNITSGASYDEGAGLMTIGTPDKWIASVSIDEVDINSIKLGQSVSVTLDALPGQTYNGKVSRISNVGSASGGVTTYKVDVTVDSDPGFKSGMSTTCEITSQSATNVVMVPVTDVKTINSQSYVMVEVSRTAAEKAEIKDLITKNDYAGLAKYMGADAQTLGITRLTDMNQLLYGEVRAVQTGIQNASYIEIKSGLNAGDKILAQTTTTSSNNNRNFMIGGMGGLTGGGAPGGYTQRTTTGSSRG